MLTTTQVALAMVLFTGAGLLGRSFNQLRQIDLVVRTSGDPIAVVKPVPLAIAEVTRRTLVESIQPMEEIVGNVMADSGGA